MQESTAVSTSTSRPKRLRSAALIERARRRAAASPTSPCALTTRSASARNCVVQRRRFPAAAAGGGFRRAARGNARNRAVGACGASSVTASAAGQPRIAEQRGAPADRRRRARKKPSAYDHSARRCLARHGERGAGIGTGEGQRLAHQICRSQFVEQRLVRAGVDFTTSSFSAPADGQRGHLRAQVFAGTVGGRVDLGLRPAPSAGRLRRSHRAWPGRPSAPHAGAPAR